MAKKTQRIMMAFECPICKNRNYVSFRNKVNTPEKLKRRKFCNYCKKTTEHKETSKLD